MCDSWGFALTKLAAGHGALSMSVNVKPSKEIYDRPLQTPGIKHKAKLGSACLNQTHSPSSFPASRALPPSAIHPHLPLPVVHLSPLLTSLSTSFVS